MLNNNKDNSNNVYIYLTLNYLEIHGYNTCTDSSLICLLNRLLYNNFTFYIRILVAAPRFWCACVTQ